MTATTAGPAACCYYQYNYRYRHNHHHHHHQHHHDYYCYYYTCCCSCSTTPTAATSSSTTRTPTTATTSTTSTTSTTTMTTAHATVAGCSSLHVALHVYVSHHHIAGTQLRKKTTTFSISNGRKGFPGRRVWGAAVMSIVEDGIISHNPKP